MTLQNRADLAAATYLEQDIRTSNPLALVARVLELAVQHVNRARAALAIRDLVVKGREVHDASRCVSLLQCSLDMEKGGDVARNMDRLYAYLLRRLTDGHLRNDDGAFQEVARHLTELAGAWREVSSRKNEPARESATAAAAAR